MVKDSVTVCLRIAGAITKVLSTKQKVESVHLGSFNTKGDKVSTTELFKTSNCSSSSSAKLFPRNRPYTYFMKNSLEKSPKNRGKKKELKLRLKSN